MSLQTGIAQLQEALHKLEQVVKEVGLYWADEKYREFTSQYYEPLEMMVRRTLQEMERLEETLRKMQRDCS